MSNPYRIIWIVDYERYFLEHKNTFPCTAMPSRVVYQLIVALYWSHTLCLCFPLLIRNNVDMFGTDSLSLFQTLAPAKVKIKHECVLVAVTAAGLISSEAQRDATLLSCRHWPELFFYFYYFSTRLPLPHPASIGTSCPLERNVPAFDEFTVNGTNLSLQQIGWTGMDFKSILSEPPG